MVASQHGCGAARSVVPFDQTLGRLDRVRGHLLESKGGELGRRLELADALEGALQVRRRQEEDVDLGEALRRETERGGVGGWVGRHEHLEGGGGSSRRCGRGKVVKEGRSTCQKTERVSRVSPRSLSIRVSVAEKTERRKKWRSGGSGAMAIVGSLNMPVLAAKRARRAECAWWCASPTYISCGRWRGRGRGRVCVWAGGG